LSDSDGTKKINNDKWSLGGLRSQRHVLLYCEELQERECPPAAHATESYTFSHIYTVKNYFFEEYPRDNKITISELSQ